MINSQRIRDIAPFTATELKQVVKELRKYRSLMWNQAQNDGKLDYAIQYYEVVRTIIYGIYFIWEKYEYENGWIDGIAEEGESLLQYQMFKMGVLERIEGLLHACKSDNIFSMFPKGELLNETVIVIYSDLLANIKKRNINLN